MVVFEDVDDLVSEFGDHLARTRGTSEAVRANYARYARAFLDTVSLDGAVDLASLDPAQVVGFVRAAAAEYKPATVRLAVTALRSFFRFLRATGRRRDRLEDAVPAVAYRRQDPPRHLPPAQLARLLSEVDTSTAIGLRDRAVLVLVGRLGLRSAEVTALRLDDLDWRHATLRITARKTGRGSVLPLPAEVGDALVAYLTAGRPSSSSRRVFVAHGGHPGAPIGRSVVEDAVRRAVDRAGIDAPWGGANLLRHSLATSLLAHGSSLIEIADLFGHRSLQTTAIYATVDRDALRRAALPWPGARP